MFIDTARDGLQEKAARIIRSYPRLLDSRRQRSAADPFVIAAAQLWNPPLVIVTQEGATNNVRKPNIPDVCEKEGLDCIPIVEVIAREDWRF